MAALSAAALLAVILEFPSVVGLGNSIGSNARRSVKGVKKTTMVAAGQLQVSAGFDH
jgi:hypothetical protein